jgi:2Fe-2S ferredoxin
MPVIRVLPHPVLCPDGLELSVSAGQTLCTALLENGIRIDHACQQQGACATCHVLIRGGFDSLTPADEKEEDQLGRAWGLESVSRLSCRVTVGEHDLIVEIPRYSINRVR